MDNCLLFMDTAELTVMWCLVLSFWDLGRVSTGVKQLPTPVTEPLRQPKFRNHTRFEVALSCATSVMYSKRLSQESEWRPSHGP